MSTCARIVIAALTTISVPAAHAQEVNLATLDGEANRVFVRAGAEYGFVAGAGYARAVSVADRRLLIAGDLTVPWATPDTADYRLRIGALAPLVGPRRWKLGAALAPTLWATENEASSMTSLGLGLSVVGGFYTPRWFGAGDIGVDWALTTHVTHSDLYRATVHTGARDGWYASTTGNLRYGLQTGVSLARYDLVVRAGKLVEVGGNAPLLPFYATMTLDVRW